MNIIAIKEWPAEYFKNTQTDETETVLFEIGGPTDEITSLVRGGHSSLVFKCRLIIIITI